jgi:hypothetical protein
MVRLTLCFVLLATALGHAVQPPAAPDAPMVATNFAGPVQQPGVGDEQQLPLAVAESPNGFNLGTGDEGICYKIRAYIFKRDDDHAPQFVKSTTCGPRQAHAKNAVWPKARIVPAN